jgi:hypothetical protein
MAIRIPLPTFMWFAGKGRITQPPDASGALLPIEYLVQVFYWLFVILL